ncbi:MAG: hypothetical protein K2Y14_01000 [Burkholderiales bacterium]|nr:hypothetical protein [Burkholderiales bacterium]
MKKKQNKVPTDFENFYNPILKLKQSLQGSLAPEPEFINSGIVLLHYSTFFITELYHYKQQDPTKALLIREVLEHAQNNMSIEFQNYHAAKIISFIDLVAKELNINNPIYIHIAIYEAYLNSQIYIRLNNRTGCLFDAHREIFNENIVSTMKKYHDGAKIVLSKL